MEHVMAKLLQEFEQGKLTRREFIQSLVVAATVAYTSGVSAETVAGERAFKAIAVNHISYEVADYQKIRDFYSGLLGMSVSHDDGRQCHLSFGETFLIPRNKPVRAPRIDHIAYTIDSWNRDEVEAELKRRGLPARPDTINSFHTKDPAGFDVQISGKEMKA